MTQPTRQMLDELMMTYCSAKRTAFKRLQQNIPKNIVIHELESFPHLTLNWRYAEHTVRDAAAEFES